MKSPLPCSGFLEGKLKQAPFWERGRLPLWQLRDPGWALPHHQLPNWSSSIWQFSVIECRESHFPKCSKSTKVKQDRGLTREHYGSHVSPHSGPPQGSHFRLHSPSLTSLQLHRREGSLTSKRSQPALPVTLCFVSFSASPVLRLLSFSTVALCIWTFFLFCLSILFVSGYHKGTNFLFKMV